MFCPTHTQIERAWSQTRSLTQFVPLLLHSPLHLHIFVPVRSLHSFVVLRLLFVANEQFQFGWTRLALICDKEDVYSISFFDVFNGTDPTNIHNLQPPVDTTANVRKYGATVGPYDMPRLEIAHAERIDLDNDNNATKDALIAAIKAKDIKVIILLGQTAFVDGIITYGIDRGVFRSGFQFMTLDKPYPSKMHNRSLAALDGMLVTTVAGVSPEYPGMQRSSM